MAEPLISIIVPIYNAAHTLKKCVDSLISQSFRNIEILLINNGSSDCSLEICNKLAAKDSRIRAINLFEKGVSAARNQGILESNGDYVMFVDADDWVDSNVCEIFAKANTKHNYDLFCFSAQYLKNKTTTKSFLFAENIDLLNSKQKEELQLKVLDPLAPTFDYKVNTRFAGSAWGKFYKRDILQKKHLHFAVETIISEDCLFNTLSLDYFLRVGYTKECFYYYKQHSDSAQNSYRPNSDKYFSFVIDQMQKWLMGTNKDQRFMDAANCLFIHYLFGIIKEDIFHRDSNISFSAKVSRLKNLLTSSPFNHIINSVNKSYFSSSERIVLSLMKNKFNIPLSILFWTYCRKSL